MKEKSMQNIKTTIRSTKYALALIWKKKEGKKLIFLQNLRSIIDVFPTLIQAVLPGMIIDELINGQDIYRLSIYVCLLLVVPILIQLCSAMVEVGSSKLSKSVNLQITAEFYNYIMDMDYAMVEDPNIQIMKERNSDTLNKVIGVSSSVTALLSAAIRLVLISSIISTLNPLIIFLVVLILAINSFVTKKTNYKSHKISKELSKDDSYLWAYTYMMGHQSYAKEIRLFNLKSLLINTYSNYKAKSDKKEVEMLKVSRVRNIILLLTNGFQYFILYFYLIMRVILNDLSVGGMTIYMTTVKQFSGALSAVFNSYLNLENSSLRIQELIEFMNMPLTANKCGYIMPCFNKDSVIEFKNVSFRYPGSERYALKNLSLTFKATEKLCIVGSNGAGKSTFIKLLTRLYCPTEGEILLDGVNINRYDYYKYQRLFSPVFQDFVRYYFSLKDNIVLSNDCDLERLNEVASSSGLNLLVEKLSKGYDTQVGKIFDEEGFEPSGGEEQRIAIARAVYHGGEIYLLDEPTAALDPMAEHEIYGRFHNMIKNKSAILITHRLSAVQLADKVAVFDDGQVVEYGTHQELYAKGGKYTEMFDKQAEFYRNADKDSK